MEDIDRLLNALVAERSIAMPIPDTNDGKRQMLRALMNTRPPGPIDPVVQELQNRVLAAMRAEKGVVECDSILPSPLYPRLRLWRGDITRLAVDAIVNAANAAMLGCFVPLHNCIDNVIHSAAGMQLRDECHRIMAAQGHEEPTGQAKITRGYNLPAKYVIHTVGPIVTGPAPTVADRRLLANCYTNCLKVAESHGLKSIAFNCISTGVFRFPQKEAADIAVATVRAYFEKIADSAIDIVIFDVFTDRDEELYGKLLGYR